jgi:glycine oxidase
LNPDFLIVGGGVIGLSTAWELGRAGASVEVIDRGPVGRESSWAGAGILFPLWPWDYAESVTAIAELGRLLYGKWVAELRESSGIDPQYRKTGLLALPPIDFERALRWCSARNMHAELLPSREVSTHLASHGQAIWLPQAAQVRNPRLVCAIARAASLRSVRIREHEDVINIACVGRRATGVTTRNGQVSAGAVIVCAGAWSRRLLGAHAAGAEIFPVRGEMLLYKADPGLLPCMVLQSDHYLVPRSDGHILVGSTQEHAGFDKSTTEAAVRSLSAAAAGMLPALAELAPIGHWAGLRPGSPGNVPVIARHPELENLYLNSGHFRYGLTMAPAAARILTNIIMGRPQPLDVAAYDWPTRWESAL